MSGRTHRRRLRGGVQPRVAELRARLVQWDVLGVYVDDDRPDDDTEYDDLIAPIMRWLDEGVGAEELSARIVRFLRDDYGLDGSHEDAQLPFATSLIDWSRSH